MRVLGVSKMLRMGRQEGLQCLANGQPPRTEQTPACRGGRRGPLSRRPAEGIPRSCPEPGRRRERRPRIVRNRFGHQGGRRGRRCFPGDLFCFGGNRRHLPPPLADNLQRLRGGADAPQARTALVPHSRRVTNQRPDGLPSSSGGGPKGLKRRDSTRQARVRHAPAGATGKTANGAASPATQPVRL